MNFFWCYVLVFYGTSTELKSRLDTMKYHVIIITCYFLADFAIIYFSIQIWCQCLKKMYFRNFTSAENDIRYKLSKLKKIEIKKMQISVLFFSYPNIGSLSYFPLPQCWMTMSVRNELKLSKLHSILSKHRELS